MATLYHWDIPLISPNYTPQTTHPFRCAAIHLYQPSLEEKQDMQGLLQREAMQCTAETEMRKDPLQRVGLSAMHRISGSRIAG